MAGLTTITAIDGAGDAISLIAGSTNGNVLIPGHSLFDVLGIPFGTPTNSIYVTPLLGTAGSGIGQPPGGAGLLGMTSSIVALLSSTLTTTLTGPLPAGSNALGTVAVTNFPTTQSVTLTALPPLVAGSATIGAVTQSGGPWSVNWSNQTVSASQAGAWTMSLGPGSAVVGTVFVQGGNTLAIKTDNSGVVQPVSLSALPLPPGAALAANQAPLHADGGSLAHITNFPATQAVTFTALPPLAPSTNIIGAVNQAGAPWTVSWTGQAVALSGSLPAGSNTLGAVSVTGTLPAGTNTIGAVSLIGGNLAAVKTDGSATIQPISVAALPLPAGAATAARQAAPGVAGTPSTDVLTIQGSANGTPIPVAGSFTFSGGNVTVTNFPTTQAVSLATLPLPAGAATSAKQPALGTAGTPSADVLTIQGVPGGTPLPVSGSFSFSGSSINVANLPTTQAISAASLPLPAGAATSARQPAIGVAGTPSTDVLTIQGASGGTPLAILASALPLPAGAATSAKQPALGTAGTASPDVLTIQGVAGAVPLIVGGSGPTGAAPVTSPVPVSGVDGSGNKQHLRTDVFGTPGDVAWASGSGSLVAISKAVVAAVQAQTAALAASGSAAPTLIVTQTTAASANLVLKNAPGKLVSVYVTVGSTGGYLLLFDAAAVPADGAVTPRHCIACPANSTTILDAPYVVAEAFANGICAAFSSNSSPYTLTSLAIPFIKGVVA